MTGRLHHDRLSPGRHDGIITAVRLNGAALNAAEVAAAFDLATAFTYDIKPFPGKDTRGGVFTLTGASPNVRRITEDAKIRPARLGDPADVWLYPDGDWRLRIEESLYVIPCPTSTT